LFSRPKATSFDAIILPHLDAAYNLARWLVQDGAMADDVIQDAMVRAITYFSSFRGDNARAWLMRIVRNAAYTTLANRRQGAVLVESQTELDSDRALAVADPADDPEAALARCEDKALLTRALATLPIELRECLILREIEELSYKEIAHITNVPIGTVMSRLWRARRDLMAWSTEVPAHG
jgi:RNA polymerase sigma-70 factor (ECF subfamily)